MVNIPVKPFQLKNKYECIIIYIIFSPIFDLLSGILIHKLHLPEGFIGSPSQIFRLLYIFIFFLLLTGRQVKICLIIAIWLVLLEIFGLFISSSLQAFMSGLNYAFKILFVFLLYYSVNNSLRHGIEINRFIYALHTSATIYALGILIPTALGVGIMTYQDMEGGVFGQRGLFASGNALGIYLGMAAMFVMLKREHSVKDIIQFIIITSALLLLGTKTALLFIVFAILVYITYSLKSFFIRLLLLLSCGFGIYLFRDSIISTLSIIYEVVFFRFERSDTFLSFIMSGRDVYIHDAFISFFQSPIWVFKILVGGGAFMSFRSFWYPGMFLDQLEMDLFDVLFMYGLIGLFLYCGICYYFLVKSFCLHRLLFLLTLAFVMHSVLAGHILFDGIPMISGVFLAVIINHFKQFKRYYKFD